MFEVIPAIDILDGKVVRLTQGDYNRVETYEMSPAEVAKSYEDKGAQKIHVVDLDGAKDGKLVNQSVIETIRKSVNCRIEFGGGIRSENTIRTLLNIGIDYVIIGSMIAKDFDKAADIISRFPHKIVAGIDAREDQVAVSGWTEQSGTSIQDLIDALNPLPVAYIIYTDIAKDGMMAGPSVDQLKKLAYTTAIPIIASGGVRSINDIDTLRELEPIGINGCIIGKAVLSGKLDLSEVWPNS